MASYTRDHMTKDGDYVLYVYKQKADILRVMLQSLYPSNTNFGFDMRRMALILSKIGIVNVKRTVECCAHIASVLWYLGYYKYIENTSQYHSDAYPEYEMDAAFWSETDESIDEH